MAAELQRLEDAARIAMGGFDDPYAIDIPATATLTQWLVRSGYAVGFSGLCAILILAVV